MDDMLRLGIITGPVGLKGEVRVYPYTDYKEKFEELDHVLIGGVKHSISRVRYQKNLAVLKLAGIETLEAAEAVRNEILYIRRDDAPPLPEGTYYVKDLMGMSVIDESGNPVGVLKTVHIGSAQDLYEIEKADGTTFLLPAVEEFILNINEGERRITVGLIEGITEL